MRNRTQLKFGQCINQAGKNQDREQKWSGEALESAGKNLELVGRFSDEELIIHETTKYDCLGFQDQVMQFFVLCSNCNV